MIPGQLIAPGQLTDPGVNLCLSARSDACNRSHEFFVSPGQFREARRVTLFERRITRYTTPSNPPCRGNFSPCEQNAKSYPGARAVLRMLINNVWDKFSNKKFKKASEICKYVRN